MPIISLFYPLCSLLTKQTYLTLIIFFQFWSFYVGEGQIDIWVALFGFPTYYSHASLSKVKHSFTQRFHTILIYFEKRLQN